MSVSFVKLFTTITDSSVWALPDAERVIWITLISMANARGNVYASVVGVANRARKTVAEVEAALRTFSAPDPYSRTKDLEGRRIVEIDGGWHLVTYQRHRQALSAEAVRESKRAWAERNRELQRERANLNDSSTEVEKVEKSSNSCSVSYSYSGSDLDLDPTRAREAGVFDAPTIVVDPNRGRCAPADFEPTDAHRVRCQELKLDVDALVRDFKAFEFNRDYSDWPKRFSRWIEDQRTRVETDRAKALSGAGKAPRSAFQRSGLPGLETSDGHARYAAKHGLDLGAIVGDLVREGVVDALGAKGAREELERRLSAAARSKAKGAA